MVNEIIASMDVNNVLKYSTALAIILGGRIISPVIAHIVILIFHKLFMFIFMFVPHSIFSKE